MNEKINEEIKTEKEYHSNGSLSYLFRYKIIPKNEINNLMYGTLNANGDLILSIEKIKYHNNGVKNWHLIYDDFGKVDKIKLETQKRADGSLIRETSPGYPLF
jgi:hypothetical protein